MVGVTTTKLKKKKILKPIFSLLIFLIQDFSLNIAFIILKVYQHVYNIHLKETVSQNFKIVPSFLFMSKNGKILIIFS